MDSIKSFRLVRLAASTAFISVTAISYGQTIINVPPDPAPRVARDGEVVNVLTGGYVSGNFDALEGSEVNLVGGFIGGSLDAMSGSQVNIRSGQVEDDFVILSGAHASISGAVLDEVTVYGQLDLSGGSLGILGLARDSVATLSGFGFKVDGVPITGFDTVGSQRQFEVPDGGYLSGIFADGTPFLFEGDRLQSGVLTLARSEDVPALARTFHLPGDEAPLGLRENQKLIINGPDARLANSFVAGEGSELELIEGRIGEKFKSIGAKVTIQGGNVDGNFQSHQNSIVNIQDGAVGSRFDLFSGSVVNVTGGQVVAITAYDDTKVNVGGGDVRGVHGRGNAEISITGGLVERFSGNTGSVSDISGGNFRYDFNVQAAQVTISGGAYPDDIRIYDGSTTTFQGFDFRINNIPVADLENVGDAKNIRLSENDLFTGVFADGTPFAFANFEEDELYHDPIRLQRTAAPTNSPAVINVPADEAPLGIRGGQTLVLHEGGMLGENFGAGRGSTVRIEGGGVGQNLEALDAQITINGGYIGGRMGLFGSSSLTVNGGEVSDARVYEGSTVNLNGGQLSAKAPGASTWSMTDGEIYLDDAYEIDFTMQGGRIELLRASTRSNVTIENGESLAVFVRDQSTLEVLGGNHEVIGSSSGSTTKIYDGRFHEVSAEQGGLLELYGGNFGTSTDRVSGSNLSNNGGLNARNLNSTIRMFGGAYGDEVNWSTSIIEIYGDDFKIDGQAVPGLELPGDLVEVDLSTGNYLSAYLTGTLSDGTPLAFFPEQIIRSQIVNSTIRLIQQAPPAIDIALVMVDAGQGPLGARPGQTVVLEDGGFFDDNFTAAEGSVVVIRGGEVYENLDVAGGEVNIEGGQVGDRLGVLPGGTVTITGGTIGRDATVFPGGVLHLAGGQLQFTAYARGGTVNISSGRAENGISVLEGGVANLTGGYVDGSIIVSENSFANVTGGRARGDFKVNAGGTLVMSGGSGSFDVEADGLASITGGVIEEYSLARAGATVNVSGGGFGDNLNNLAGEQFTLNGQHFEIDGTPITGLSQPGDELIVTITNEQLFTGTLADGSPFAFTNNEGDRIQTVRLVRSADLPTGPTTIDVSVGEGPGGAYAGQTLKLQPTGVLPDNFNAGRDSTVYIQGGIAGDNFEAYAATVHIESGSVGQDFSAFPESEINISGGSVGNNVYLYRDATINVSGGIAGRTRAAEGSVLNVSGGVVSSLGAENGSQVLWDGGTIAALDFVNAGAALEVHGADFQINGNSIPDLMLEESLLQLDLEAGDVLTGLLADGTPMVLETYSRNSHLPVAGTLTLVRSANPIAPSPSETVVSSKESPQSAGENQSVRVIAGGELPNYFIAGPGSSILIEDGLVNNGFRGFDSEILVQGGQIGTDFLALEGVDLTITGGNFANGLRLTEGSNTRISGGTIPTVFIHEGANVDLFGTEFLLDGQPIPGLRRNDSTILQVRGSRVLTGILGDGSELRWVLSSSATRNNPYFIDFGANLQLHLIPEPTTVVLTMFCIFTGLVHQRPTRRPY